MTNSTLQNPSEALHLEDAAKGRSPWWLLFLALALLLVADGRNTIALAAWLAPALLLRFVRTQPAAKGLVLAYLALLATRTVAMRGMIPIPGVFYYVFMFISCASAILPYVADRLMARCFRGHANTLIFPCTLVVTQFIYAQGPMGSWGSIPYTQAGSLALLQLLSVTGLWGITFLIGWFASTVNNAWERPARTQQRFYPLSLWAVAILAVLLGGGARLAFFPPSSTNVRVASLSTNADGPVISGDLLKSVVAGKSTAAELEQFRSASRKSEDRLMARSTREAEAGAKIIFWAETSLYLLKQDEAGVLDRGRALAAAHRIYLGMALGTWTPGASKPLENKLVMIDPAGSIVWQYLKARPTPGPEAASAVASDGKLRLADTPFGKVSAAICYDTDFPGLLAQAGDRRVDILLSPAGDWQAVDPRHTEIASFRAIEQGFNLVRQSKGGLSAAFDYQGHRLSTMDEYNTVDHTLVSLLPIRGVRTFYSRAGNWAAWLCVLGLAILLGSAYARRRVSRL